MAFENKLIRTTCENEESAKEQYGVEVAAKLKARLADLRAAKNVSELIVGNPQEVKSNPYPTYKMDLCDGFKIKFCANHVKVPTMESGDIHWSKVNRILILDVENF